MSTLGTKGANASIYLKVESKFPPPPVNTNFSVTISVLKCKVWPFQKPELSLLFVATLGYIIQKEILSQGQKFPFIGGGGPLINVCFSLHDSVLQTIDMPFILLSIAIYKLVIHISVKMQKCNTTKISDLSYLHLSIFTSSMGPLVREMKKYAKLQGYYEKLF